MTWGSAKRQYNGMRTIGGGGMATGSMDSYCLQNQFLDLLEFNCHVAINHDGNRHEVAMMNLEQLVSFEPIERLVPKHGRIYSRIAIASFLDRLREPTTDNQVQNKGQQNKPDSYLKELDPSQWQFLIDSLEFLRKALIRKDANVWVGAADTTWEEGEDDSTKDETNEEFKEEFHPEDAGENSDLSASKEFTESYEDVKILFMMQKCISIFRRELGRIQDTPEKTVSRSQKGKEYGRHAFDRSFKRSEVGLRFTKCVEETFPEDHEIRDKLLSYLNPLKTSVRPLANAVCKRTNARSVSFKPETHLKKLLEKEEFSIEFLLNSVRGLVRQWDQAVLSEASLASIGYGNEQGKSPRLYGGCEHGQESPNYTGQNVAYASDSFSDGDSETTVSEGTPAEAKTAKTRRISRAKTGQSNSGSQSSMGDDVVEDDSYHRTSQRRHGRKSDSTDDNERQSPQTRRSKRGFGAKANVVRPKPASAKGMRHSSQRKPSQLGEESNQKGNLSVAVGELSNAVQDPLPEVEEIASRANKEKKYTVEKKHFTAKRKSRYQERFEDSVEESSDIFEQLPSSRQLTGPSSRPRMRLSSPQRLSTPVRKRIKTDRYGRYGTEEDMKPLRRRNRFTDEEKDAIRTGVERFGFGNWAFIKEYYSKILRDRSTVNIKDCYRTMEKQGLV